MRTVVLLFHVSSVEGFVEDLHGVPIGINLIHGLVHSSIYIPCAIPERGIHHRNHNMVHGGQLSIVVKGPVLF